jgi:hypothetical protein
MAEAYHWEAKRKERALERHSVSKPQKQEKKGAKV